MTDFWYTKEGFGVRSTDPRSELELIRDITEWVREDDVAWLWSQVAQFVALTWAAEARAGLSKAKAEPF